MKKLLPLVFLLVGSGAGVGAGIFLRPEAPAPAAATTALDGNTDTADAVETDKSDVEKVETEEGEETAQNEYAKLSNQFVIPIVKGESITSLVVMALSVEVPAGKSDIVYAREPKLRDSFLQVLFDHANIGGFEGNFTDADVLGSLRTALREIAKRDLGRDVAKDILIVEIARQDY